MQTFVLAPQSPKKYYVHNDIFRYQDEVFHDDTDGENQDEVGGTSVVLSYLLTIICSSAEMEQIVGAFVVRLDLLSILSFSNVGHIDGYTKLVRTL